MGRRRRREEWQMAVNGPMGLRGRDYPQGGPSKGKERLRNKGEKWGG
jgi:hypothetical protein